MRLNTSKGYTYIKLRYVNTTCRLKKSQLVLERHNLNYFSLFWIETLQNVQIKKWRPESMSCSWVNSTGNDSQSAQHCLTGSIFLPGKVSWKKVEMYCTIFMKYLGNPHRCESLTVHIVKTEQTVLCWCEFFGSKYNVWLDLNTEVKPPMITIIFQSPTPPVMICIPVVSPLWLWRLSPSLIKQENRLSNERKSR